MESKHFKPNDNNSDIIGVWSTYNSIAVANMNIRFLNNENWISCVFSGHCVFLLISHNKLCSWILMPKRKQYAFNNDIFYSQIVHLANSDAQMVSVSPQACDVTVLPVA